LTNIFCARELYQRQGYYGKGNLKPMKILVLGTRGFPNIQGGVEAHCENLYPHLAKRGCKVIVFARKPYTNRLKPYSFKGIKIISISCPRNKFLEAFVHTFKGIMAARKVKPDIVHIHAVGPGFFVPLARMCGFKVIMTNHGPDYKRKKWPYPAKIFLRLSEYLGSVSANKVIAISHPIYRQLRGSYKIKAKIIPNGVVPGLITGNRDILNSFGLIQKKYILAVGRFVPEKGFHDLIKAFCLFHEKAQGVNREWKLVIAGKADHEDAYSRNLKSTARFNENIILAGFLTGKDLHQIYSHAGLFVLPSYYEGLPIALLEAMSFGLSCIASNIEANIEVGLSHDRFFIPGQVKNLSEKIEKFVKKQMSIRERENQIQFIKENYNWESIAERTLEVYNEILSNTN
jgi:glycosyltransferase involved in cell wall biosynthesis